MQQEMDEQEKDFAEILQESKKESSEKISALK